MDQGKLIFFCGKMGAGKSTRSKAMAKEPKRVLLSEDEWLASLYPDQINTFEEYIEYSSKIKPLIRALVIDILQTGSDVIMDFPANTKRQRQWFKELALEAKANHKLIYLKISNETCLKQIAKRRIEQPKRAKFDTPEVFHAVTQYFEEPIESEALTIQLIGEIQNKEGKINA